MTWGALGMNVEVVSDNANSLSHACAQAEPTSLSSAEMGTGIRNGLERLSPHVSTRSTTSQLSRAIFLP
jgi:hypothetical protein